MDKEYEEESTNEKKKHKFPLRHLNIVFKKALGSRF